VVTRVTIYDCYAVFQPALVSMKTSGVLFALSRPSSVFDSNDPINFYLNSDFFHWYCQGFIIL